MKSPRFLKKIKPAAVGLALAALAFNLFLLWLYYQAPRPKLLYGDENYYVRVGVAISRGLPPNHDSLWPPLYGELMGRLLLLFGNHRLSIQLFQVFLWGLTAFLFWRILLRLSPSPLARRVSFLLLLFCPELAAFSHYFWPETVHLFFWVASLWLIIDFPGKLWSSTSAGAVLGLALLTKSVLKPFLPVLLAAVLLASTGAPFKKKLLRAGAGALALFLVLLPALLDNWRHYRRFALPDSAIFNIWVGITDDNPGRELDAFRMAGPDIWARNQAFRDKILDKVRRDGSLTVLKRQASKQYFRLFSAKTFFTTQLPGGERHVYRFKIRGAASALRGWSYIVYGILLVAGTAGLAFLRFSRKNPAVLFFLFILYNLGVFLFLHANTRYVIPFLPMLAYFAGLAVDRIFSGGEPPGHNSVMGVGRLRDALAAALVLLVAFLSFGPMLFRL